MDRELNRKIAEGAMGEPEPPELEYYPGGVRFKETKEPLETGFLGGHNSMFAPDGQLSPGGAWYIHLEYDEGDEPNWRPINFSDSLEHAEAAFDSFAAIKGGMEPTLLMERYKGGKPGEHWMAYYSMRYGYGETPAKAICRLIATLLDQPEDWEEPYEDSEETSRPRFTGSSFVFSGESKDEDMKKRVQEYIDHHFEKGAITKVTVRYRTDRGEEA